MINDKGLCKALKEAYNHGGYDVMPLPERGDVTDAYPIRSITICARTWMVRCLECNLPLAVAEQIVKDCGYLPTSPVHISKAESPRDILLVYAAQRIDQLAAAMSEVERMLPIPIIYRDDWQLYQSESGEVYAFDRALLDMIAPTFDMPIDTIVAADGAIGAWAYRDRVVYIAPATMIGAPAHHLRHIRALDWLGQQAEQQIDNMSLFAEDEEVAPDAEVMGDDE